jgi:hypothetical protein
MSDPGRPPSDELDELASAYLDGEVTPDERAQVDADPDLVARVGELRAVRSALAAPPGQPDASTRERALAAARAEASARAAAGATMGTVASIERRRSRRALAVIGAVAAAVIAIALVAVVATRPSSHDRTSSASLDTRARDAATSGGAATTASAAAAPSEAVTAPPTTLAAGSATTIASGGATASAAASASAGAQPPFLGVADDDDALRALVTGDKTAAASAQPVTPASNSCAVPSAALVGIVTWQGTMALVFVGNGSATVVDAADCRPLAVVPLT